MRLREVRVELDGSFGSGEPIVSLPPEEETQVDLRARYHRPGTRIVRVDLDSAAAQADDRFAAARIANVAGDVVLARHQVELVRLGVGGPALLDCFFLLGQKFQLQCRNDRLRDFVLQRENVVELAIVALGPHMTARSAIDQLGGDANATAGLAHAALEQMAHLELPRSLWRIDMLALEREGGVARGDPERRDLAQVSDDVFADPVREILLLRIAAHVGERQHGYRDTARRFSAACSNFVPRGGMRGEGANRAL